MKISTKEYRILILTATNKKEHHTKADNNNNNKKNETRESKIKYLLCFFMHAKRLQYIYSSLCIN